MFRETRKALAKDMTDVALSKTRAEEREHILRAKLRLGKYLKFLDQEIENGKE